MARRIFHDFVDRHSRNGDLVVQPRMGFSDPTEMRKGLKAVAALPSPTIGTITVDSYTRQRMHENAKHAILRGERLNGYPIVHFRGETNTQLLADLHCAGFPVQVRHGSPEPIDIFQAAQEAGLDAIEGGPISYCLPYGRVSLERSVLAWQEAVTRWTAGSTDEDRFHIESFAGCMLGQLCPPSMLVALGIVEGLFFAELGVNSISLSYAQGTNSAQDMGAIVALQRLAAKHLGGLLAHVVTYTNMGLFPRSESGARRLIEESARISIIARAGRLIVKTAAEAHGIPTIEENLEAIGWAHLAAQNARDTALPIEALKWADIVELEAEKILEHTLSQAAKLPDVILLAFRKGLLDVPYCIHPDNANRARVRLGPRGEVLWRNAGSVPVGIPPISSLADSDRAAELLDMLSWNQRHYDEPGHPR